MTTKKAPTWRGGQNGKGLIEPNLDAWKAIEAVIEAFDGEIVAGIPGPQLSLFDDLEGES